MLKTTLKTTVLTSVLALSSTIAANALSVNPDDVKNTYLKNCLSNGGDKAVCDCSYSKALQVMTISDLATINTQMATGVHDSQLAARLEHVTRECAAATVKTSDASALPPPPPPPPMADLQAVPDKQPDNSAPKNYMTAITQPPKPPVAIDEAPTPGLSKNDQAKMDQANGVPIEQAPVSPDNNQVAENPAPAKPTVIKAAASGEKPTRHKSIYNQYDRMFFDAAARGDEDAMHAYAQKVNDFNVKNENGDTALTVAAYYGQLGSVNYLIEKHADVNQKNLKGMTALHIASYSKHANIVEVLLEAKANPNLTYSAGGQTYTPLVLAIMQGDMTAVQLLLQGKAKVNEILNDGNTVLHIAAVAADPQILQLLAQNGGKLNLKNKAGDTPLMIAAYSGNAVGVSALLQLGADPKIKDKTGRNALALAQAAGKQDAANVLSQVQQ